MYKLDSIKSKKWILKTIFFSIDTQPLFKPEFSFLFDHKLFINDSWHTPKHPAWLQPPNTKCWAVVRNSPHINSMPQHIFNKDTIPHLGIS